MFVSVISVTERGAKSGSTVERECARRANKRAQNEDRGGGVVSWSSTRSSVETGRSRLIDTESPRVVVCATESVLLHHMLFARDDRVLPQLRATMKLRGVLAPLSRRAYKHGKNLPRPIASSALLYVFSASLPVPNTKNRTYPVTTWPHLSMVTWPLAGTLTMVLKRVGSWMRDHEYVSVAFVLARHSTTSSQVV